MNSIRLISIDMSFNKSALKSVTHVRRCLLIRQLINYVLVGPTYHRTLVSSVYLYPVAPFTNMV